MKRIFFADKITARLIQAIPASMTETAVDSAGRIACGETVDVVVSTKLILHNQISLLLVTKLPK